MLLLQQDRAKAIKPNGGGAIPGALEKRIVADLGSVAKMKEDFIAAGVGQFGSGWCWLAIKDGKVVTLLQDHPLETTFYKLGDTVFGARSNEFGYANYELLAKGPQMLDPLPKAVAEKLAKKNQADFLHYDSEVK